MKEGALSSFILSSDDYFYSSILWNKYQHILHVIEEELESAIRVIEKWEKREDDRKGEEPRWTRNDEMKYRGIINKCKGSTTRRVMDLHGAYRGIKTLRETIVNSQDQVRAVLLPPPHPKIWYLLCVAFNYESFLRITTET